MALEILGNIELEGGLTTSSAYARTTADVNIEGNRLRILTNLWTSKTQYDNIGGEIYLNEPIPVVFDYNRQTDGVDLVDIANNKIKDYLEELGYSVVISEL